MRLDMICLLTLAMALRDRAGELVRVREYDLPSGAGLYQAVMYRLCHGPRPWVLALDDILPCCLFECPDNRLRR